VRKDGGTVWVELRLVPFRDGEGRLTAIEGTVVDIDKAVKAEEELRRSEAHYRLVFETAGSAMVIIDEEGVMQSVNSAYERLSGYSRAEIEGKARWTSFLDPGYASTLIQEYAESARDPAAASKGHPFRIKDKFGRELALVAYTAVIPGTGKTVVSMVDETERVRYEEAMQQAGKKMDLLAKITRHDVMNQLAALFGYLELVQEREADPDTRALLAKARTASESIRRHIEFARDYQSMGRKRPQWVDVLSACRRAASNIELRGVRVVTELEGLEVFADPMLEKVFYNLVDNSLKHGVRTTTVTFSYIHGPEGMRLVYEDDGAGVPDQEKAAIFERTAADRDGPRGYGLYLAREILAMTGITISETGRFGEGARFEMLVPKGRYRTKMGPERPGHGRRGRAL
jgi:PAS domain S-box-containing protein